MTKLEGARSPTTTLPKRLLSVALPLLILGLAAVRGVAVCPSAVFLHHPCPGCGLTRATKALFSGDLAGASAYQPLALVIVPLLLGVLGYTLVRYVVTGKAGDARWMGRVMVAVFAALFLVWAARMFGAFGGPVPV